MHAAAQHCEAAGLAGRRVADVGKKLFLDSKFADVVILKNRKLYQLPARQPQYITNHRERKLSGI